MTQYRVQHNRNYTVINNTIVTDNRLSWKAKGIWLYAFAQRDDWKFYKSDLLKQSKDSDTSLDSGLKELENCGYLIRVRKRNEKGQLGESIWTFFEVPQSKEDLEKLGFTIHSEPKPGFPNQVNPNQVNVPLTNTDCLTSTKEQQQVQGALPPEPPSLPAAVAVSSNEEEKKKLLKKIDFSEDSISSSCRQYDLERIKTAIEALSRSEEGKDIPNKCGWIVSALKGEWQPKETEASIEAEKAKEEAQRNARILDNKSQANALFHLHKSKFTPDFHFQCTNDGIQVKTKLRFGILHYSESDCIDRLKKTIEMYGKN